MPEPWRVKRVHSNGHEMCPRILAGRDVVAQVWGPMYLGFAEALSRAYLLAAAPELLETCRECLVALNDYRNWRGTKEPEIEDSALIRQLEAVIAKATQEAPA